MSSGDFQNWHFKEAALFIKNCQTLPQELRLNPLLVNKIQTLFGSATQEEIKASLTVAEFGQVIKVAVANESLFQKAIDLYKTYYGNLDSEGRTYRTPLHIAIEYKNLEVIDALLKNGAYIHAKDKQGQTPLHLAVKLGNLEAIKALLEKGANVNEKDKQGQTPLHYAMENDNLEVINALLEKGANVNAKDVSGRTPLHLAALVGNLKAVKAILKNGADVNAKDDEDGQTPLHYAMENEKLEIINALLKNSAEIEAKDKQGRTPLHLAAIVGNPKAIHHLFIKRANIHAKDKQGRTPLHIAAKYKNLKVINALLEKGAKVNAKDDEYGQTPLHVAAVYGEAKTVVALLKKGAKVNAKDDAYGRTPLHDAVQFGKLEIIQALLQNGADIHAKGKKGHTPLHIAAIFEKLEVINALLQNNADIHAKDKQGQTPLHIAAEYKNIKGIKAFLEKGAKVNAKDDEYGQTPLHVAARTGEAETVEVLLKNGADIHAKDKRGLTPLEYALNEKRVELIPILLNIGVQQALKSNNHPLAIELLDKCASFLTNFNVLSNETWEIIKQQFPNATELQVPFCEQLLRDNRPIPSAVVDSLLNGLQRSFPLILRRPLLLRYLMDSYGLRIEEEVKKLTQPQEKAQFLPLFTPSEIIEIVNAVQNDYAEAKSKAEAEINLEAFNRATSEDAISEFIVYEITHRILPGTPYVAVALIARDNPELIRPYLLSLEDAQLAAVIPFFPRQELMKILFKEDKKLAIPLIKLAEWVKRMPFDLKKEVFSKLHDELLFYPRAYDKLIQAAQKKDLKEEESNAIRMGYAGLEREELPLTKLAQAFNQGDVDRHINNLIQKEIEEGANKKLLLKSLVDSLSKSDNGERELEDFETGEVMRVPIKTPGYQVIIDESTFLNEEMFPRRTVTSRDKDGNVVQSSEIKNFYDNNWYPEAAYTVDVELKKRLDEFHSKANTSADTRPTKKQKMTDEEDDR